MKKSVLIVDDESSVREAVSLLLVDTYNVSLVESGKEALEKLEKEKFDIVLLDILMPDMDGLEVVKKIKESEPGVEVIMVTATRTIETAVQAIKFGAYEYITKPFDKDKLLTIIKRALEKKALINENIALREEITGKQKCREIIGKSRRMKEILKIIDKVAGEDVAVLISGESGTGKEVIARAIHQKSNRANKPFVAVNCGAIPPDLLESELFGHEKGAFTSAVNRHIGKFEFANEGTIFLDDIANLPMAGQSKLLRVIQEREIMRIGSNKVIPIDVRIISSTNVDLEKTIKEDKFREDLYYRLRVVPIFTPPLRQRKEDIPLLFNYFLNKANVQLHKQIKGIRQDALDALMNYHWPGNVRELENLVDMLVVLCDKEEMTLQDLPGNILAVQYEASEFEGISLKEALSQFETQFVLGIMKKTRWNQTEAAKLMGMHRNTLKLKLKEMGIEK